MADDKVQGAPRRAARRPAVLPPFAAPAQPSTTTDLPPADLVAEAPAATALAAVQAADMVEVATAPVAAAAEAVVAAVPAPVPQSLVPQTAASPASPRDDRPAPAPATLQQGPETMATAPEMTDRAAATATEATAFSADRMQSMFGDMGARFKTSFEKSSKLGEEMVELARGNVEAVVASARVAAKGGETIGQDAADYGKKSFESAVAAMKSFAAVKSPTELFQLQSDFARASFDSAVAEASRFSESMLKLANDVAQPLSTRYAVAAEKIKSAGL